MEETSKQLAAALKAIHAARENHIGRVDLSQRTSTDLLHALHAATIAVVRACEADLERIREESQATPGKRGA